MVNKQVKSKAGTPLFLVVLRPDESMPDTEGMCIACGEFCDGVEPDARRYRCEGCGKEKVFGIEELCLMGLMRIEGAEVARG